MLTTASFWPTTSPRDRDDGRFPDIYEQVEVWSSLCDRIQITGPIPIRFQVIPPLSSLGQFPKVRVSTSVPERDAQRGDLIEISMQRELPWRNREIDRLFYLRRLVHELYLHEADEMFMYWDEANAHFERPFDPHRGQK